MSGGKTGPSDSDSKVMFAHANEKQITTAVFSSSKGASNDAKFSAGNVPLF